ncbi:hypothetical protein C3F34_13920 [Acinetobacter sp. ACNIH2]|nr:hypothetical protein C3F34_13920 [Acinetobacter sp. ACNIH2]
MKQIECLSQTQERTTNKSKTTACLYQHPTPENTVQYKSSGLATAALVAITICTVILSGITSCSADRHQTAAQTEHLVKAGVKP